MAEPANLFGVPDPEAPIAVVVQISPAAGWRAAFADEDELDGYEAEDLACFALVEVLTPGQPLPERMIRPMVTGDDGGGFDPGEDEAFICLIPPRITATTEASFVKEAMKRALETGQ